MFWKTLLLVSGIFLLSPIGQVNAAGFSGSDINQYTCSPGAVTSGVATFLLDLFSSCSDPTTDGVFNCDGRFVCYFPDGNNGFEVKDAIPRPPTLRVLEVWFVRILFAIWALSGIVFTFILISIGVEYMFSFGNEVAVGKVIKRFQNFLLGFVLVFLSYPLLNTFFNILPINDESQCFEQINMPGFQFFFPQACGAPTELDNCIRSCNYSIVCEFACNQDEQARLCRENCGSDSICRRNCPE